MLSWALFSSVFALLSYVPFSWQLLGSRLVPRWVELALSLHAWWYAAVCLAGGFVLRRRLSRRGGWLAFAAVQTVFFIIVLLHPWAELTSRRLSLALALLAWEPLLAWEALLLFDGPSLRWTLDSPSEAGEDRLLLGCLLAGACAWLFFSAAALARDASGGAGVLMALAWSLALHLVLALAAFAWLSLLRRLAASARMESLLVFGSFWLAGYWLLAEVAFNALSFFGVPAHACAAVFAAGLAAALAGQCRLLAAEVPVAGLALICLPARRLLDRSPWLAAAGGAAAVFVPAWLLTGTAVLDWNGLLAVLSAAAAWLVLFGLAHEALPETLELPGRGWVVAVILAVACGDVWAASAFAAALARQGAPFAEALGRLEGREPSLRAARLLFRKAGGKAPLYSFLKARTNILSETPVRPFEQDLVDSFGPGLSAKPDIFIFALDSLRPDYIGAYNPAATFTPQIDRFAKDNLVVRKAFAAYGGTGLSQPSLWSGSHLLHKQYVEPFAPMNTLEKLLEHEGYQRWLTRDIILSAILRKLPGDERLDAGRVGDYKLCATLEEVSARLRRRRGGAPVFVFSRPEDLHISILERDGRGKDSDARFPGFYAPYAERLQAADACFGRFIAGLKQAGRYEDSLIILTADHGESLGELSRWGHAYTIYPEVLKVPLIIHAPRRLLAGKRVDLDRPAYLTDLVPTLYDLLGQPPTKESFPFGRSLLGSAPAEPRLVASSYGAVYGVVDAAGRRLYVRDGVDYGSFLFDLDDPRPQLGADAPPEAQDEGDVFIRRRLEELDRLYGFSPR